MSETGRSPRRHCTLDPNLCRPRLKSEEYEAIAQRYRVRKLRVLSTKSLNRHRYSVFEEWGYAERTWRLT